MTQEEFHEMATQMGLGSEEDKVIYYRLFIAREQQAPITRAELLETMRTFKQFLLLADLKREGTTSIN